jgi:hypothetical protein
LERRLYCLPSTWKYPDILDTQLVFWLKGRFGEDNGSDNPDTTRHPIVFDADLQAFIAADYPFEFPINYLGNPVKWSPDGQALVFTDGSKNLIHLNAQTGVTTLLDTNVSIVIDWVETTSITCSATVPANDTAALVAIAGAKFPHQFRAICVAGGLRPHLAKAAIQHLPDFV